jgi:hypothetical protein
VLLNTCSLRLVIVLHLSDDLSVQPEVAEDEKGRSEEPALCSASSAWVEQQGLLFSLPGLL